MPYMVAPDEKRKYNKVGGKRAQPSPHPEAGKLLPPEISGFCLTDKNPPDEKTAEDKEQPYSVEHKPS